MKQIVKDREEYWFQKWYESPDYGVLSFDEYIKEKENE